ncbi:MAG TPA: HEAT repeat domain-containing protein, partial [Planctomycetota bacterium]|nr:HEAT repeat domain-containing protein [Planctomycetota bacterium]
MNPLRRAWLAFALLVGATATGGCSSWQHIETRERWTLYAKPGEQLDSERIHRALATAFVAVESKLGPFEDRVRIHAWDDSPQSGKEPVLAPKGVDPIEDVPGIGKARVRAYHVTGGAGPFASTGVFLGTCEIGTIVHELVHARLAEARNGVPLWFEEGLAALWGDGACYDGEWIFDGLACWPARVLREEPISDEELTRVMQLTASEKCSSRENLLVHFVGWAVVFDLAREMPDANIRTWLAQFQLGADVKGLLAETRERIARSTSSETLETWLARLEDPSPGIRLATAKGLWKLRSQSAVDKLVAGAKQESDQRARLAMGLTALLAVGEMRVGRRTWREIWRGVVPALGEIELEDEAEQIALQQFLTGMRGRGGDTQPGLDRLAA